MHWRLRAPVVLGALLFLGCSSDSPVNPTRSYELRPTYYFIDFDRRIHLDTSPELLAIRFYESVSQPTIDDFLAEWSLTLRNEVAWDIHLVSVDDAFERAPRLWEQGDLVEYVGPVLQWIHSDREPRHLYLGNEITLRGDVTDVEVASLLARAHAELVHEDDERGFYAYTLPWGDAGAVFDLANTLYDHPAIERAAPQLRPVHQEEQ